jgi:hypothetical protein
VSDEKREAYDELCCYTLAHGGREFVHQHVVDAFAAQDAASTDKPVRLAFALIGLYLHLEKGLTGREVQLEHMRLAKRRHVWPRVPLPASRGEMSAIQVMQSPPGPQRDAAIDAWCASVWDAYRGAEAAVVALLDESRSEKTARSRDA